MTSMHSRLFSLLLLSKIIYLLLTNIWWCQILIFTNMLMSSFSSSSYFVIWYFSHYLCFLTALLMHLSQIKQHKISTSTFAIDLVDAATVLWKFVFMSNWWNKLQLRGINCPLWLLGVADAYPFIDIVLWRQLKYMRWTLLRKISVQGNLRDGISHVTGWADMPFLMLQTQQKGFLKT
jgi:hypothetical protein